MMACIDLGPRRARVVRRDRRPRRPARTAVDAVNGRFKLVIAYVLVWLNDVATRDRRAGFPNSSENTLMAFHILIF